MRSCREDDMPRRIKTVPATTKPPVLPTSNIGNHIPNSAARSQNFTEPLEYMANISQMLRHKIECDHIKSVRVCCGQRRHIREYINTKLFSQDVCMFTAVLEPDACQTVRLAPRQIPPVTTSKV